MLGNQYRWHKAERSLAMIAMGLLVSCSVAPVAPEDTDQWKNSQRPVLKERAEGRWAALIKRDMDKVYAYNTPAYRDVVTLQQFQGKYGRAVNWTVAEAQDIRYDAPTVASVSVEVTYQMAMPGVRGKLLEDKKVLT